MFIVCQYEDWKYEFDESDIKAGGDALLAFNAHEAEAHPGGAYAFFREPEED